MTKLVNKLWMLSLLFICLMLHSSAAQILTTPKECGTNEEYLACGPACQTECATLNQPCLIAFFRCPDGCYCLKGFARNARGTCIPIADCQK